MASRPQAGAPAGPFKNDRTDSGVKAAVGVAIVNKNMPIVCSA